ncbi:M23 family metallopeptidase [Maribacter halichondriae]|uniref:M23 family metallopeptidase n=1 Tax=Maribacter halichondriae TaxID=2980554 RepID=UPI00235A352C|nr:M23 family metallopeptidase [Maribacter sp. Hal144]
MVQRTLIIMVLSLMSYQFHSCTKSDRDTRRPGSKNTVESLAESGGTDIRCNNVRYEDWKTSEYVLPYAVGETYRTNLTNCTSSYHAPGMPDQFAIDFAMPIGTEITAARPGQVFHIEESGIDGGFPNNLAIIAHSDGTFAAYMHLTENGALAEVGSFILQGDIIGLSGNTGLAGYPHLHFVVIKEKPLEFPYTSVPVTFKNTLDNERSLLPYTDYPAYPYE